jgi:hypothetical protein
VSAARQLLDEALAQLDVAEKLERHEVLAALHPAAKAAKDAGETVNELRYELIAAELVLYDEPTDWGTYFGPWASGTNEDGKRIDTPPLDVITPECVAYWRTRMQNATNPALRARYADLVWDFSHKVTGKKPPIDAAHIAIDGYVDALVSGRCEPFDGSGQVQKRALNLATLVNDAGRLQHAIAKLVEYAASPHEAEERDGRQRELFALLMQIRGSLRPITELQSLANDLRTRLDELDAAQADQFTIQDFALPLAGYYRSLQQHEEAKTVLRMYGAAVTRMSQNAMALLAVGWLNQLYQLYLRFEMNEDATQVMRQIETVQPGVPANLVKVSVPHKIDGAELEEWLVSLVTPDRQASILQLVIQFLPRLGEAREQMEQLRDEHRLSSLFSSTLVDHAGRQVAQIGGGESDEEGNIVHHIHQNIQFADFFLAAGLERLFTSHGVTAETLVAELTQSPIWHENRHAILRRGVESFFTNDPIAAIHILVTEIENAVRNIAAGLGLSLQKRNRMGGFDLKNLSDFLADEKIGAFLTEDVTTYLRVVLTDRRGWNLRNDTCHGILPAKRFTQAASRRLVHIMLLLSTIRLNVAAKNQP